MIRFLGYSFTNSCYATSEKEVANDLYDALTQFFQLFNTLKNNDFYVTGESYAGKYVPAISYKIHTSNKLLMKNARPRDVINLKVSTFFLGSAVQLNLTFCLIHLLMFIIWHNARDLLLVMDCVTPKQWWDMATFYSMLVW